MELTNVRVCDLLEIGVILFQVFGVGGLCLTRLMPRSPWAVRGRVAFVVAMIGLGIAGAICGRNDSEFALFAGGTMTALLIGMTAGDSAVDTTRPAPLCAAPEQPLAA